MTAKGNFDIFKPNFEIFTCSEYIATSITTRGKLSIVARSTVDPIGFGTKLLVN